jgi:hypothetical protein
MAPAEADAASADTDARTCMFTFAAPAPRKQGAWAATFVQRRHHARCDHCVTTDRRFCRRLTMPPFRVRSLPHAGCLCRCAYCVDQGVFAHSRWRSPQCRRKCECDFHGSPSQGTGVSNADARRPRSTIKERLRQRAPNNRAIYHARMTFEIPSTDQQLFRLLRGDLERCTSSASPSAPFQDSRSG